MEKAESVDDTEETLRAAYMAATAEREAVEATLKAAKAKELEARKSLLEYMKDHSSLFNKK
jgi:hypothetical protein